MPLRDAHRSLAVLMATCLALALAASFAACSGAPEERPAPAATAPPAAPQPTGTSSPTPVAAPQPTEAPSPTAVATVAPTETPSPTAEATVEPTATPSPTPVATVEPTATPSPTPVATVVPTGTPSPTSFRYDTYDSTGAVATAGSYAFLADPADTTSAVTTYEALRDGTTTALLIHKSDAHGASQAALYDAVAAGDLFEWHEADDCFVRYTVNEVKPDPAGTVPRKLLAVEWMTYAFTGCSGAVSANAPATVDWGELPDLGGAGLTAPVVHGLTQLVPEVWTGAVEALDLRNDPGGPPADLVTMDLATARSLAYWREPQLPEGWTFERAERGGLTAPVFGYCARYNNARRYLGVEICGYHVRVGGDTQPATWLDGLGIAETRVVGGRPVIVLYSPQARIMSQLSRFRRGSTMRRQALAIGCGGWIPACWAATSTPSSG